MKVELLHREHKFAPRNVSNLTTWMARQARQLPLETTLIIRRGSGTLQYRLNSMRRWDFLRQTFGPSS